MDILGNQIAMVCLENIFIYQGDIAIETVLLIMNRNRINRRGEDR